MGSALLNIGDEVELAGGEGNLAPALRTQVAERLAAHRSRRGRVQGQAATEPMRPAAEGRSAEIAAAVAERYARTPSYREVLAAEAERAIQQAHAVAEVAARNAQAIAAAQQRMLDAYDEDERRAVEAQPRHTNDFSEKRQELKAAAGAEQELWPDLALSRRSDTTAETVRAKKTARVAEVRATAANDSVDSGGRETAASAPATVLTVRLYGQGAEFGDILSASTKAIPAPGGYREGHRYGEDRRGYSRHNNEAEAMALDEEIAFRQAPVFEESAGPPVALPANLIEFPRQLVAARKARPRYAEGPLRDEAETAAADGQLRIFEVDPAQISTVPAEAEAAQWTSLWLDGPTKAERTGAATEEADGLDAAPAGAVAVLQPASLGRRAAAGAINLAIAGCGLVAFAAVSLAVAGHGVAGHAGGVNLARTGLQSKTIAIIGGVGGAFLVTLYHGLFFWFSTATPGMRCVRVALCTFEDGNPTRKGVRRRMAATLLSACSLGMGYAWAALDEDRLTWHDRMSGMYLRRY